MNLDKIKEESYFPFEIYNKYLDFNNQFISDKINEIEKSMNSEIEGLDFREQGSIINKYNEYYLNFLNSTFPDIQNKTSLIIVYNTFENRIKSLCEILERELSCPIKYSELNGPDLLRMKKFLIKFCGINAEILDTDYWSQMNCIRILRNNVVHNNSDISEALKKEKQSISTFDKIEGFEIIEPSFLAIISTHFIHYVLKIISDIYNDLFAELEKIKNSGLN